MSAKLTPAQIRTAFNRAVSETTQLKQLFSMDPHTNFSRERKLPFPKLLQLILSLSSHSMPVEINNFFSSSDDLPSTPAVFQRRKNLLPDAFLYLFHSFMESVPLPAANGLRMIAVDSSTTALPRNCDDPATFIQAKPGLSDYNAAVINAFFDINNHVYTDFVVESFTDRDDTRALFSMTDRLRDPSSVLIVGDRYYGVMNVIANMLLRNVHFLFRCKDISSNGFAAALGLPDGSFDIQITKTLTKSKKKAFRNDPNYYVVQANTIDLLDSNHPFQKVSFRLVRFRIPNSDRFELIATDLPADSYPAAVIADIYHARWGIETSFRSLKFDLSLLHFHSGRMQFILQEIFASFIVYNFASLISSCVPEHITTPRKKPVASRCHVKFALAVSVAIRFLLDRISPHDVLSRLRSSIIPFRPARPNTRKNHMNKQPAKPYNYRAS